MNLPILCKYCLLLGTSSMMIMNLGGKLVCINCGREGHDDLPEKPTSQVFYLGNPVSIVGTASAISTSTVAQFYQSGSLIKL